MDPAAFAQLLASHGLHPEVAQALTSHPGVFQAMSSHPMFAPNGRFGRPMENMGSQVPLRDVMGGRGMMGGSPGGWSTAGVGLAGGMF